MGVFMLPFGNSDQEIHIYWVQAAQNISHIRNKIVSMFSFGGASHRLLVKVIKSSIIGVQHVRIETVAHLLI